MDWVYDFINSVFTEIGELGEYFISVLPKSPLQWSANIDNKTLAWINWLIPIGEMVVVAQAWLGVIITWYIIRVPLHWLKVAMS